MTGLTRATSVTALLVALGLIPNAVFAGGQKRAPKPTYYSVPPGYPTPSYAVYPAPYPASGSFGYPGYSAPPGYAPPTYAYGASSTYSFAPPASYAAAPTYSYAPQPPAYSAPAAYSPTVTYQAPAASTGTASAPAQGLAPTSDQIRLSTGVRSALADALVEFYNKSESSSISGSAAEAKLDKIKALRDEAAKRYASLVASTDGGTTTADGNAGDLTAAEKRDVDTLVEFVLQAVRSDSTRFSYPPFNGGGPAPGWPAAGSGATYVVLQPAPNYYQQPPGYWVPLVPVQVKHGKVKQH